MEQLQAYSILATRVHDQKLVYIKAVISDDERVQTAIMLSSNSMRYNPRNHAIPILDVFQDDDIPFMSFIVVPLLRPFNELPFEHVNEVIDVVGQLLEVRKLYFSSCCKTHEVP